MTVYDTETGLWAFCDQCGDRIGDGEGESLTGGQHACDECFDAAMQDCGLSDCSNESGGES